MSPGQAQPKSVAEWRGQVNERLENIENCLKKLEPLSELATRNDERLKGLRINVNGLWAVCSIFGTAVIYVFINHLFK
ncbi:MAG: hypothetical protein WCT06_06945 [Armatimonadota bacterium]|jgi:hypothetical protein|nr:hypothetical protein [Armatimonadota bacterium]